MISVSLTLTITSPFCIPAFIAGESIATEVINAPTGRLNFSAISLETVFVLRPT